MVSAPASTTEPVADLAPMVIVAVSRDSETSSSSVTNVIVNVVTPVGTVMVPSELSVTPLEKLLLDKVPK